MADKTFYDVKTGITKKYIDQLDGTYAEVVVTAAMVSGPATIADGGDINAGTTTDVAVITDVAGTISAKLRGLIKLLAAIIYTKAVCNDIVANCPSGIDSAALEASHVIKASAGILYHIRGYSSAAQYILIFDSATVPIDTTLAKIIISVNAGATFTEDFGPYGKAFANGISWSNSSTIPTKTIGGSTCLVNVLYK